MKRDGVNTVRIVMIIATVRRAVSMARVCRFCLAEQKVGSAFVFAAFRGD